MLLRRSGLAPGMAVETISASSSPLVAALGVLEEGPLLIVVEGYGRRRGVGSGGGQRALHLGLQRAGVDDDGARGEVSQALEVAPQDHGEHSAHPHQGEEVHVAQQVAHDAGPGRDGGAVIVHHDEAEGALAWGGPASPDLKDDGVEPLQAEEEDEEEAQRGVSRASEDHGRHRVDGGADEQIDGEGGGAGQQAGHREPQQHPLRGFDLSPGVNALIHHTSP
jgi:hypothetical protein